MASPAAEAWQLPFSREEYDGRLARVREEMTKRNLDLLYITAPQNLNYLLGHRSVWFADRNIAGLAIPRAADVAPLWFDAAIHAPSWPPTIQEKVIFGDGLNYYPEGPRVVAEVLKERGLLSGRVGVEYWSWAPRGPVLRELARCLGEAGADEVIDGSFVVDHIALVKSPAELACVYKALEIADRAHEVVRDSLKPGMTEKQIVSLYYSTCADLGSDEPGIRTMLRSGPNTDKFHWPASERRIQDGELMMVDMSAAYHFYHGNTARAFSIGPNPFWDDALKKLEQGLYETTSQIKLGDPTIKLQRLMDAFIDQAGLRKYVWWAGGYTLGISVPPDWVGHVFLDDALSFEPGVFDVGFVVNWEVQLWDTEKHEGVGLIDTMVMTESGLDLPATYQRTLTVV